ncbi:MAG: CPBP family intramembrane metalloprotease [Bacteroidota bacterium]|nr:CPBP family intramembrane metalloprotease [Bacteroidota bacterium]
MAYLKSRPAGVQLLLFVGMAFGIFLVISLVGVVILTNITGISLFEITDAGNWDFKNPNMITFVRGMLIIQFLGLFLIPSLLFAYFSDPRPMQYLGLKNPHKAIYFLLGFAVLLLALPLVEWLGTVNREVRFPSGIDKWMENNEKQAADQIQFMLSKNTVKDLIINLIFISGFAAIGEELFFRGVLQRLFIRIFKNPWAGIITTAFIFSAIHFQFYGFIPRFILGILLGVIYWYSGSLLPAILAHFFYDAFFIVLIYFNPAMLNNQDETLFKSSMIAVPGILSLVLVTGLVWWIRKQSAVTYDQVYANDKLPPPDPFSF